jgi:hypothetical protein
MRISGRLNGIGTDEQNMRKWKEGVIGQLILDFYKKTFNGEVNIVERI